jgi:hypothetical protein
LYWSTWAASRSIVLKSERAAMVSLSTDAHQRRATRWWRLCVS